MGQTLPVTFTATARSSGKMRCDLDIALRDPSGSVRESWELATDEGDFHGGDATAPPPLAYFSAGLTACLMTQIRAFSKRLNIGIRGVAIDSSCQWEAHLDGRNPYETEPIGFKLDVTFDSDASKEELLTLLAAAKKGCFIDQTLRRENTVTHRLIHEGETTVLERDGSQNV